MQRERRVRRGGLLVVLALSSCGLAILAFLLARELDTSTELILTTGPLKAADGSWDVPALREVCEAALEAHGVDPARIRQVEYATGILVGKNVSNPNRALTTFEVGEPPRRVTVYVEVEGDRASCLVSESK